MNLNWAILRVSSLLVPSRERTQWLEDWQTELWYVERRAWKTIQFSLGSFRDAIALRRESPEARGAPQSSASCLLLLGTLAAVSTFAFLRIHPQVQGPVLSHMLMVLIAFLILPATIPLTFGVYPRARRSRRWIFVGLKLLLAGLTVFCATPLLSARGIQPHAMLVGYVLGFRWALFDQRKRCPVCLRRLVSPARIGRRSQIFLEWYGTESFCVRGHGLMHVPEVAVSHTAPEWRPLDASWSSLF